MENREAAQYIENINIKGLWGRYDVNWQLHADVNILVGENGTGKSTILEAVKNSFELTERLAKDLKMSDYFNVAFSEITVVFKNGKEKYDFTVQQSVLARLIYDSNNSNESSHNIEHTPVSLITKKETLELLKTKIFNIHHIKTFDKAIKNGTDDYKTNLDIELNRLEKEYLAYQLKTFKAGLKDKKALNTHQYFLETVNRLFKSTGKSLDEDDEKISFLFENAESIHWLALSSGEKQLLIILLTVLCQDEKPSILLMDEPELSLHITWQYELINIIRQLNPNCQVIIATHSTSIFTKGWMNKLFFMDGVEGIRHKIAQPV